MWTFDCGVAPGNFVVVVKNADGTNSDNLTVNQSGRRNSGTENYHQGGEFYLEVNSTCAAWTLTVVDIGATAGSVAASPSPSPAATIAAAEDPIAKTGSSQRAGLAFGLLLLVVGWLMRRDGDRSGGSAKLNN